MKSRVCLAAVLALLMELGASCSFISDSKPGLAFTEVVPGLSYVHITDTNGPWSIHVARLDLSRREFRFATALANDVVLETATVPEQALGTGGPHAHPVLAVNGDFFEIRPVPYRGDPQGILIREGELISLGEAPAFWVDAAGRPHIGEIYPRARLTWPDGSTTRFDVNGPVRSNAPSLFTPTFGESTRATNALEFILEPVAIGPWLPLRVGQEFQARVQAVPTSGNTPLESDRMVLAASPLQSPPARKVQVGDVLRFSTECKPALANVPTALGGWPILVSENRSREWRLKPGRVDLRHPRTAVGFNDRYLYLVVVDGRQSWLSVGMTFAELGTFMRRLGCTEALNLDGGGSSTFWLGGSVMNSPSGFFLRPVANALVLLREER